MPYKHKQVSDINTHQPQFFHHHTLQLFCEELTKQMRGVKTTPRDGKSQWVYVDGEMMARGWVGYGDYQSSRYGDPKLVVYARGISNGKYGDYSDQYYMKMSVNMDPVLKAAKGHLTKYTTHEVERVYRRAVREKVNNKRDTLSSQERSALSSTGLSVYGASKGKIIQELRHLVMSGHTFADPQFGQDVQLLLEVKEALSCLPNVVPMDFVHIYPTPWETRADILAVPDALSAFYGGTLTQLTWVAEELPESVMGKIAVMQMCEDGQYVDGVGLRVNESTFYLHKESDDTWK